VIRRGPALLAVAALVVGLVAILSAVPVPYVSLGPGPVCNTAGAPTGQCSSRFAGTLIKVTPASATYPKHDTLALTTVTETTGISLLNALATYLSAGHAVIPREVIFPPGQSVAQVSRQDTQEMAQAQDSAVVAALSYLKLVRVRVAVVEPKSPAYGVLRPGDLLTDLDGQPIANTEELVNSLSALHPGQKVTLTVSRSGRTITRSLVLEHNPRSQTTGYIGIVINNKLLHGLSVQVGLTGIGGPSAGLMLTLGILDKLLPYSITGGRIVAGTGTIDDLGNVGAIGGIQQKMFAARHDEHATVFLAPAGDCSEAAQAVPAGLIVYKVRTLAVALSDLAALRAGRTNLPTC
jgi:PDZ domain-containing protein